MELVPIYSTYYYIEAARLIKMVQISRESLTMAKRRVHKSNKIREILAANPKATVKEIQAALAAKRIKVSVALISKLKAGEKRNVQKLLKSNGEADGVTLDHLLAAKALVVRVGSVDAAQQSLSVLAKLLA